jgi:AraC family transcriptional activator FtrA
MEVDAGLERLVTAGTVWIPGWQGIDVPVPHAILDALREAHRRGARLLSICSGSFVIAATGLLDGKRATTHWRYAQALQRAYPRIQVDPDVLYVDQGQIMTSAGSAAGLDLCLHLVRRDHGPEMANQVARRLVIAPHRSGGQAQFLQRPIEKGPHNTLSSVLEKVRRSLAEPLSISMLAQMAAMSERTFMRRFRAGTGMSPGDWITLQRVDRARELLESTQLSIDQIAAHTGLGTATTLRHHFRRKVGVSPAEYRRRFSRQRADLHLVG